MIESYGLSHPGCVRRDNEDRILIDDELGLFAVADGMGGQKHGALAAELAISAVHRYVEHSKDRYDVTWPFGYSFDVSLDANRLTTGIRLANRHVWRHAEQSPEFVGMGSTVAALLFGRNALAVGNVGDSRVYVFRNGRLQQLTVDDTWIASLSSTGLLAPEEARRHPMRNVLTQAAGAQETVDVHICEETPHRGDLYLLSSDGLHGLVDEETLSSLLARQEDLSSISQQLLRCAEERNAPDNVSVVLLRYGA